MGYAARRKGLAGVVALGAGHYPSGLLVAFPRLTPYLQKAKEMVAAGDGGKSANFIDASSSGDYSISTTAADYVSWMAPGGPASLFDNLKNIKPGTPLLWVVGKRETIPPTRNRAWSFDTAPKHPKSEFVWVDADHLGTPSAAIEEVAAWLRNL